MDLFGTLLVKDTIIFTITNVNMSIFTINTITVINNTSPIVVIIKLH